MTRRQIRAFGTMAILVAAMLPAGGPLIAHHAWPVSYSQAVTVKGTVTGYDWTNPHVMIGLEVKTDSGAVEKWNVGGPSTARMQGNGWDRATLKPGDVITATGYRFSDGQRILRLDKVIMPNGREMLLYGRR